MITVMLLCFLEVRANLYSDLLKAPQRGGVVKRKQPAPQRHFEQKGNATLSNDQSDG